jgi:hypothetical protein
VAKTKAKAKAKPGKKPAAKAVAPKKLPTVAKKPARPSKPSLPLPPPPPPPPPTRDELDADRDIARLLRYGEKFGAKKIDIRMRPLALPVAQVRSPSAIRASRRAGRSSTARRAAASFASCSRAHTRQARLA